MDRISPLRDVTDAEIEAFWHDGVVCLRSILPAELLDSMVQPVEDALVSTAMADLSEMGDALASGGVTRVVDGAVDGAGVYLFEYVVHGTPAASISIRASSRRATARTARGMVDACS